MIVSERRLPPAAVDAVKGIFAGRAGELAVLEAAAGRGDKLAGELEAADRRLLDALEILVTSGEVAQAEALVTAILLNGRVRTIDRTTGKPDRLPDRPRLLSVSAERPKLMDLLLAEAEPAACVKQRLNALVSPNPFDMEAIELFITFDLRRFRFTGDLDVVAGLDSRPNLLKLSPEFAGAARTSRGKASGNTAIEHDDQRPGRIPES